MIFNDVEINSLEELEALSEFQILGESEKENLRIILENK